MLRSMISAERRRTLSLATLTVVLVVLTTLAGCGPPQILFALGDTIGQGFARKKGERWDYPREQCSRATPRFNHAVFYVDVHTNR